MTEAERYARDVVSGKVVAGKWIKLAAKRFLSDLERDDIEFDVLEANRVVNFFEMFLRHWEGAWASKPIILEDWQKFILQQVFAWKKNGKKRIRSVYVQIARKNAKTTLAAGIALYHLIADSENAPQIYVGANNEDQAKMCTNTAGRILEESGKLRTYIRNGQISLYSYKEKVNTIGFKKRNGSITAMSRDAKTKDGFNPSLGIIDEFHEAKDDKLLNVIESGQGARMEPLLFVITTAGFNKGGPCYSKLRDVSVKMLDGVMEDDSHLAFVYESDEGDDWKDEKTWIKSNPNLGVSVSLDYLRSRLTKAVNEGGSKEVDFRTKNLNEWCDAEKVWIQDAIWVQNTHGIRLSDLLGKACYGGLDCAKTQDFNAFSLIFPDYFEIKGKLICPILPLLWLPEARINSNSDRVDYKKWKDQGHIIQTPGNIADYNQIENDIVAAIDKYDFRGLDYDPAYAGNVASN